jgi:hypothetical protein
LNDSFDPPGSSFKIAFLQLSGYVICVETGDSEIVVVEGRSVSLLFDSKEALAYPRYALLLNAA